MLSGEDIAGIFDSTTEQAASETWSRCRTGRITASRCGHILRSINRNTFPDSLFKTIYGLYRFSTPAMEHGLYYERTAIELYQMERKVEVKPAGLMLSRNGIFGCSADGLLDLADSAFEGQTVNNLGLVEVKCPFKHRSNSISEALEDPNFCLDSHRILKKSHPYWDQVQMCLYLSRRAYCDFVVYTFVELNICRVYIDPQWSLNFAKLFNFYRQKFLPNLAKFNGKMPE